MPKGSSALRMSLSRPKAKNITGAVLDDVDTDLRNGFFDLLVAADRAVDVTAKR
ncbi:hypothetical protein [Bradyrhizobium glycinis]|uniref:hypothetical protein n=1 Tax=Bradyrhizobium glycinis TaxID=2751812 RepID=UPI0018D5D48C|nr:hypothetical protein [Bradyrhizobium glycinis]MBH5370978.1 hypothetical protein [Bradyrhizobium glycinis]